MPFRALSELTRRITRNLLPFFHLRLREINPIILLTTFRRSDVWNLNLFIPLTELFSSSLAWCSIGFRRIATIKLMYSISHHFISNFSFAFLLRFVIVLQDFIFHHNIAQPRRIFRYKIVTLYIIPCYHKYSPCHTKFKRKFQ